MKKFLSFMTALLLAVVFTATGVHAAPNPSATNTYKATENGKEVTVTTISKDQVAKAKDEKDVYVTVDVNLPQDGKQHTVVLNNKSVFGNGKTFTYTHYYGGSDDGYGADAQVEGPFTVTSVNGSITLTLTGGSPVVIKEVSASNAAGTKGTTAVAGGNGTAVPNTVDAE